MVTRSKKKKTVRSKTRVSSSYYYYGLLLLVIVFFAAIRFRLRTMPLERDEGEYAYAGQLMLQGIAPYKLVYSMKLPGIYAAYALLLAIFGQTSAGVHLGLLLVNAATTVLLFLLATYLWDRLAGFIAAASYALLSTGPSVLGFAGHATHFVVIATFGGILVLRPSRQNEPGCFSSVGSCWVLPIS
jgi:hypothetical protein